METARVILERGGVVGIFPEGTRVRPGPARRAEARRRPAGARDRAPRSSRSRSSAPSDSAAAGDPPRARDRPLRARADLPPAARPRAAPVAGAGDLEPRVVVHLAPVGVARRPAADPPRRRGRRRQLGHRGRDAAGARRAPRSSSVCRTRRAGARARHRPARTRAYLPGRRAARRRAGQDRVDELRLDEVDLVCLAVPSQALDGRARVASREPTARGRRRAGAVQGPRRAPAARCRPGSC